MAYQLLLYYLIFLLLFHPVKKKEKHSFKKVWTIDNWMVFKIQFKVIDPNNHELIRMYGIEWNYFVMYPNIPQLCSHTIFTLPLWKQFVQLKNIPVKIKGISKVSGYQSVAKSHIHSIKNPMLTWCLHLRKNCAIEKKVLNLKKNVFILTDSGLGRKKEMMIESKFIVRSFLR